MVCGSCVAHLRPPPPIRALACFVAGEPGGGTSAVWCRRRMRRRGSRKCRQRVCRRRAAVGVGCAATVICDQNGLCVQCMCRIRITYMKKCPVVTNFSISFISSSKSVISGSKCLYSSAMSYRNLGITKYK